MRPLSDIEKMIIEKIAERIDPSLKTQLLWDMEHAKAEVIKGKEYLVTFHIENYQRPKSGGKHDYLIDGEVNDIDGVKISIWLFADQNNRLLELEFCRCDNEIQEVISPNWDTLKFY